MGELDHRPHTRQQISAPMLRFACQRCDLFLASPLLGYITGYLRCPDNFSFVIPDRRHRQRNVDQTAIFSLPDRFEMIDALPASDPRQNFNFSVRRSSGMTIVMDCPTASWAV
jgi:hypothetical protein